MGSIGGAAGDAGVEYRRAVAAYAVVHGLAGAPLLGFGNRIAGDRVIAVVLETDNAVDDIRIEFASGERSMVQAKRSLQKGKPFDSAVRQWVAAAPSLDASRDHLVVVAGRLSGPMRTLQDVLNMFTMDTVGTLTKKQKDELASLDLHLAALSADQKLTLLRCASIHELQVEEPPLAQSREGIHLLRDVVSPDHTLNAWTALTRIAGRAARMRGGYRLDSWMNELRREGIAVDARDSTPAADLERRHRVVARYLDRLRRQAELLDLRPLGAEIPPIPLNDVDAEVSVLTGDDDRDKSDLLWALLRRGRVVLTGLPGGGKTTALRRIAGGLARLDEGWFPVTISLRVVDALGPDKSFRDRLVTVAAGAVPVTDRELFRAELERFLTEGRITLLLDGLDETYEHRGEVVSEIHALTDELPDHAELLLATRDVAYGQAATLGWPALSLAGPANLDHLTGGLLRTGADQHFAAAPDPSEESIRRWIADRREWIDAAIAADPTLKETPLLPTLLTLLAIERSTGALPRGRVQILLAVIESVISREKRRADPFALGALVGEEAAKAALQAFEAEGQQILQAGGTTGRQSLIEHVAGIFGATWGLAPGRALVAAEAAVRWWDEAGIFVISGEEETVAPRIQLFAEIGAAQTAARMSGEHLREWVEGTARQGAIEPLILAAGLSREAAGQLAALAASTRDSQLLQATAQAWVAGAEFNPEEAQPALNGLVQDASDGTREGWSSWVLVANAEVVPVSSGQLEAALTAYPEAHQIVGRALIDLRFRTAGELVDAPERLLDVLTVRNLARLPSRIDPEGSGRLSFVVDPGLTKAVEGAASQLLGVVPEALERVRAFLDDGGGSMNLHNRLLHLLQEKGFGAEASKVISSEVSRWSGIAKRWLDFDREGHKKFLRFLAAQPARHLAPSEERRLDQLASLCEWLNLNNASGWLGRSEQEEAYSRVGLFMALADLDPKVVAAQARVVLRRLEATNDDSGAFFSLFDNIQELDVAHWDTIEGHGAAVDQLLPMFFWGVGSAIAAARALWEPPVAVAAHAAPRVREILPPLASSTQHLQIAASTLASMPGVPEPATWKEDEDPVLRAVAAKMTDPVADGRVSPTLRGLLTDPDGNVRLAAVERVGRSAAEDRIELLGPVAAGPDPGWMCLSCRTDNPAGASPCQKEGCFRAAPGPAAEAQRAIQRT